MKTNIRFLVIVLVLGASILACNFGTPGSSSSSESAPSAENILFQDDFSNTNSGWDQVRTEDGITDYESGGVYRIQVLTANTDIWANPGKNFSDTRIEVEATKVGGADDNDFGLICRYQDVNNFYFFMISSDGYYGVGRVANGNQELIGMQEMPPSDAINKGNTKNLIRADCVGSTLTLYVNNVQLTSQTDSTFTSGDVGLLAGTYDEIGTDIHFDNFRVIQP
jgi:hypothetical protein